MKFRRFFIEDWLASCKDSCRYNLGESGIPNISLGRLLELCGETPESLSGIVLKDHDTRGTARLRSAIASTYGSAVPFENVTVTTGTSEALFILFNLLLEIRTSVVAPFPAFQALYEAPRALGADVRFYRLGAAAGFIPDPDEVCSLIDDTTGVVVINSPHNPSGVIVPDDIAIRILEKAAHHGATVLSDEHYRFLPIHRDPPLKTLANHKDGHVVATGSITKCFGLIGLRVGWIVASEQLVARIRDFRDYLTHTLSPLSDYCAALALEHAPRFIEPARAVLGENLMKLKSTIGAIEGLSLVEPEGGVVAFPGYDYPVSSNDLAGRLIKEHSVFVLPGSSFETEGHFRINLGQDPRLFGEALEHIKTFCKSLAPLRDSPPGPLSNL